MSAVPTELDFRERTDPDPSGRRLSFSATIYLAAIAVIAVLLAAPFATRLQKNFRSNSLLAILK